MEFNGFKESDPNDSRYRIKLASNVIPIAIDNSVPAGTMYLVSRRKRLATGELEPEEEWAKRCAKITNIGSRGRED